MCLVCHIPHVNSTLTLVGTSCALINSGSEGEVIPLQARCGPEGE